MGNMCAIGITVPPPHIVIIEVHADDPPPMCLPIVPLVPASPVGSLKAEAPISRSASMVCIKQGF